MTWIGVASGSTFALLGAACVLLVLVGAPGIWLMVLGAICTDVFLAPRIGDGGAIFGWIPIGIAAALAVAAEVVEVAAAADGPRRGGPTRAGAIGALIGGIGGGILGTIFLLPVVGSLIGAAMGAVAGAVVGELSVGRTLRQSAKPAAGAAAGRLLGTLAKLPLAAGAWLALTIAAFMA